MDNKPSYQVLKAVLARMEANKRIQIMAACPSLRRVDKAVPLTIQHLEFYYDNFIKINDKIYKMGLIREYRDGKPTETIQEANNQGGLDWDVDEWGFERQSYGQVETPGDLVLYEIVEEEEDAYDDERRRTHEEAIKGYKEAYGRAVEDIQQLHDSNIDFHETALLPYICRETNTKPAHDCFIQLSLKTTLFEDRVQPICKLPYNRKLYEAMNSFMNFIFGGRRHSIEVKRLGVHGEQIIRLPEGVKFYVHELKATCALNTISSIMTTVLDESCMPIKHINKYDLDEREHPFMKNAEEITLFTLNLGREQNFFEVVQSLPQLRVNLPREHNKFKRGEFTTFIKNKLENDGKSIGTRYQFGIENKKKVIKLLVSIKNQCKEKAIQFDNKHLVLQMEGTKQMHISYKKNNEFMRNLCIYSPSEYLLKIEIVEQK